MAPIQSGSAVLRDTSGVVLRHEARAAAVRRALAGIEHEGQDWEALVDFWGQCVRDTTGRFEFVGEQSWYRGAQPVPELSTAEQSARIARYLEANLRCREVFLQGLAEPARLVTCEAFSEWVFTLHGVQCYFDDSVHRWNYTRYGMDLGHLREELGRIALRHGDPYHDHPSVEVRLPGIQKSLPSARHRDGSLDYWYPSPDAEREYLEQSRLHLLAWSALPDDAPLARQVDEIAWMYLYGVSAHPFKRVNHSLFMNMANALLEVSGLRGIEQGIADLVAMVMQPSTFVAYFREEVARANPGTFEAPAPTPSQAAGWELAAVDGARARVDGCAALVGSGPPAGQVARAWLDLENAIGWTYAQLEKVALVASAAPAPGLERAGAELSRSLDELRSLRTRLAPASEGFLDALTAEVSARVRAAIAMGPADSSTPGTPERMEVWREVRELVALARAESCRQLQTDDQGLAHARLWNLEGELDPGFDLHEVLWGEPEAVRVKWT